MNGAHRGDGKRCRGVDMGMGMSSSVATPLAKPAEMLLRQHECGWRHSVPRQEQRIPAYDATQDRYVMYLVYRNREKSLA